MLVRLIIFTIIGFTAASAGTRITKSAADHLTPIDGSDSTQEKYRRLLASKLGLTPFDCARVTDSSSLGPEAIVSVWSKTEHGQRNYRLTCAEASENLWQRTKSMREPTGEQAIAIRRTDAEIPASVAEKVRAVWSAALRNVRPPPRLREEELVVHGYLQFSIQEASGPPRGGELWLPPAGPKTRALAKISNALWEYCKATPARRSAIANEIGREATRLLEQLK